MNIVVLDGHTMNPGDLSWERLKKTGKCRIYPRTAPEEVVRRACHADILLTNKVVVPGSAIAELPRLKYIGVLATGYNIVDIEAAKERGIPVTNVPAYGTAAVAQMTFAHILNLTTHVAHHAQSVREGTWSRSKDFCFWEYPLVELAGLTLGIIGFGRIGRAVGEIARSFGMTVVVNNGRRVPALFRGIRHVTLPRLFRESDIVTLHCPLTEKTRGIINKKSLSLMKPSAFLINTSRGFLVDEKALAAALKAGTIAGAGLDVMSEEPPRRRNPLFRVKNCFVTPHIAWATAAARIRLMDTVVDNIEAFLHEKPLHVVNGIDYKR